MERLEYGALQFSLPFMVPNVQNRNIAAGRNGRTGVARYADAYCNYCDTGCQRNTDITHRVQNNNKWKKKTCFSFLCIFSLQKTI